MTFIVDMNVLYSVRSLRVVGAQTFGLPKVEGLTFIPIKVRLLLFKKDDNFPFCVCYVKKRRGRVSSVRYCLKVLIG